MSMLLVPILDTLRTVGSRALEAWPDSRRARYLLRECPLPLSVDRDVTPIATVLDLPADVFRLVAVAALTERSSETWRQSGLLLGGIGGAQSDSRHWLPLGYDVLDLTMRSGLTNCAPTARQLSAFWRFALNEHHLFWRLDDADSFREYLDEMVPEHAPFVILQLFAVTSNAEYQSEG
jgi:hypothetical protein